ncbi:MAG: hypothetical protein KatS3mg054_0362 [Chloroflexus sp.]|nr:MAG: hypothetical protein KatS3mg054_0362 [Chloroflexus sp.]
MYTTESKAIWHAQRDQWAKAKGFALVLTKQGTFDYVLGGTPLVNGEQMLARFAFVGNRWRRYEWNGRWVRV